METFSLRSSSIDRARLHPGAQITPSATSLFVFFFNLSALPSSGLALLPGKLSPQRSMGNSRPLLRVPGPEDFPSSSKQSPRPESHWSRLGHVPILEPITVASGICKMNGLLVGHTSTQTTWMWEKHHFPKEN